LRGIKREMRGRDEWMEGDLGSRGTHGRGWWRRWREAEAGRREREINCRVNGRLRE